MRHQINYVKNVKSWAVIDPRLGDKVHSLTNTKEAETALDWYKKSMPKRLGERFKR